LIASKIVSTTGGEIVVSILHDIVGVVIYRALFTLVEGSGITSFNLDSVYSVGIAAIGVIIALALHHAFPPPYDVMVSKSRFPPEHLPRNSNFFTYLTPGAFPIARGPFPNGLSLLGFLCLFTPNRQPVREPVPGQSRSSKE
jgi:hypothetical protein